MFAILAIVCFYNTHINQRVRKRSVRNGTRTAMEDGTSGVIEVDVDIANATTAPNAGYLITIPGGQRFWTYAIRANYICGSGMTYRYSQDVNYNTVTEPDARGIVLVSFIGILITAAFCSTWPILLTIGKRLQGIKKDLGTVNDNVNGANARLDLLLKDRNINTDELQAQEKAANESNSNKSSSKDSKKCHVGSVFAYTWMCVTGVIVLFIGIVGAQLICSMMGWRNFYHKRVSNQCFYVDRSGIAESDVPADALRRARDALGVHTESDDMPTSADPANIIESALVNYDDITDTAVFLMGSSAAKHTMRDMHGSKVTYLFVPPTIQQGRIGDDNCSTRVSMYKITGVDVSDYQPSAYNKPLVKRKCYGRPTPTGEQLSKCKATPITRTGFSSARFLSDGTELLYDTANAFNSTGYDIGDNSVLKVLASRDDDDRKYGYCTPDGCINSRIYMSYKTDRSTWRHCRRPPVQNITTPGSVTIFVSGGSHGSGSSGTFESLPDDGWQVPISKTDSDTDEYYTDGAAVINKAYSGYTRDNEYSASTLLALFRKTKRVNVSVKFDYIDDTLFAHDQSGEQSLEGKLKVDSEVVRYLKDKAMSSLAASSKRIYSTVWRTTGDVYTEVISTITTSMYHGSISAYTLHNASTYGVFVNRSCSSVHAYTNSTKTYIETQDDRRCIVAVAYDTVNAYITLSRGSPADITGSGQWRCVTNSTDPSTGTSCSTNNDLMAFTPYSAQSAPDGASSENNASGGQQPGSNSSIGVIPPDIMPNPLSEQELDEAAGNTNISESNVGEVNNKASTSSALIIVVVVILAIVVVVVVVAIIVHVVRKRRNSQSEGSGGDDGNEMSAEENSTVADMRDGAHS